MSADNNKKNIKKEDEKDQDLKENQNNNESISNLDKEDKPIKEKLRETEDKLLRSLAEIENQRRRFEKEIKDAFEFGSFNFAKEILATMDNLQRARLAVTNDEKLKNSQDLDKFLENFTILEKDLITIFEKNKIMKIDTKNQKFDPNKHQAMSEVEDENIEPGSVVQEIQAGYMLGERLLRPALVGVSKKKIIEKGQKEEKKED